MGRFARDQSSCHNSLTKKVVDFFAPVLAILAIACLSTNCAKAISIVLQLFLCQLWLLDSALKLFVDAIEFGFFIFRIAGLPVVFTNTKSASPKRGVCTKFVYFIYTIHTCV